VVPLNREHQRAEGGNGAKGGQTGHLVTLSANLKVDGAPVPDQPVRFTLAGQPCGPSLTDATGHAFCELTDSISTISAAVGAPITASFAGDSVYASARTTATFGGHLGPIKVPPLPPPTTTTGTTTTGSAVGTAVTVITEAMGAAPFTFTLSTATQPNIVSDTPGAGELNVPPGTVTFTVSNPDSNILSHTFEVCTTPLAKPVTTLPAVQKLPPTCSGKSTPLLGPGGATATLTVDLTTPGAYEYLSTANNPKGDAYSGMKGVLNVT
jgi:hypothetical protein